MSKIIQLNEISWRGGSRLFHTCPGWNFTIPNMQFTMQCQYYKRRQWTEHINHVGMSYAWQ